jgi:hypothetical protein
VELTFTPDDGGTPVVASFADPDGDGGVSGTSEDIALALGTSYALEIALRNELVDPPVDITGEIEADAEEHLFFLLGDAVSGPASSSGTALVTTGYADLESDYGANDVGEDLPVGLRHTIEATSAGTGQLRVMLRHLPALNGEPQKSADLPAELADGNQLPGEVDVDVRFDLSVL